MLKVAQKVLGRRMLLSKQWLGITGLEVEQITSDLTISTFNISQSQQILYFPRAV